MNSTAYNLSEVYRHFGTLTEISMLCKQFEYWPEVTKEDAENVKQAIKRRLVLRCGNGRLDFHAVGKKVLAFVTAYRARREDVLSDTFEADQAESDWMLAKQVLRWFVEHAEMEVKQKCVEFLNKELTPEDWQDITDHGCGFLKKSETMYETTDKEKRDMARVFTEVRDDITGHLTRFWLELFERYGVQGAKDWIRDYWHPLNNETREKINAAYIAAKEEFENEEKATFRPAAVDVRQY